MKNRNLSEFFKYSSANILGMIGLSCYILADTYFVQKGMGSIGLSALNLAIPVYSIINGMGLMTGIGGATRFSVEKCGGKENANGAFTCSVIICAVMSAIFMTAGVFFSRDISVLLGADGETLEMCSTYIRVILLFSPMFMLNNTVQAFVRNDSYPRLAMAGMLLGSFSNIILDYIFIFPLNMGIFGAALATGIAPVVGLAITSVHFIRRKNTFKLTRFRLSFAYLMRLLGAGLSSFVTELSAGIVMIIFNLIMLELEGNTGVAAYGIIANLSLVVLSVYTGMAQGIQPLMSRAYGEGKMQTAKKLLKYAVISVAVISSAVYALFFFEADIITHIFNSENNIYLARVAENGLRLYFIGCLFAGLNIIFASYFSATEKGLYGSAVSFLRGVILIVPLAFIMSRLLGTNGLWLSFAAAEAITCIIALVLLKKRKY